MDGSSRMCMNSKKANAPQSARRNGLESSMAKNRNELSLKYSGKFQTVYAKFHREYQGEGESS
jgi:hypothetical protein